MDRQKLLDQVAVALQRVDHELRTVRATQRELDLAVNDLETARASLEHAFDRLLEAEPSQAEMSALMLDSNRAQS